MSLLTGGLLGTGATSSQNAFSFFSNLFTNFFNMLGIGNPAVVNIGCATELGSCSVNLEAENQINGGFWWRLYQGRFGSFRFGAQYSYTKLESFAGANGAHAPTDDSMVFTSIRYYPF